MSSPKLINIQQDDKKPTVSKSVPINIASKISVPMESESPPKLLQTSLYKTERCRSWISTGMCKYGNKCQFAHGEDELRPVMRHPKYKTQICKTFSRDGFCPYSSRCRFIHPGEIDTKSDGSEYEYEGNSLPNESPLMGRMSMSPSPMSPMMGNNIFSDRAMVSEGFNPQDNHLFSSSLPTFNTNWLTEMKDQKTNPLWNLPSNNNSNNPSINKSKNIQISETSNLDLSDDYDPFNFKESQLHSSNNSLQKSPSPNRKSDIFSPKNNFFHPSSPISQFHFSPSPISNGFFNLSNPTITSPNNNVLPFNLDDSGSNINTNVKEQDVTLVKKRTKSIPGELFILKDNSPVIKSKPTSIPQGNHNHLNHTNNNSVGNNSSPSDSKARLPIFASLAN